MLRTGGPEPPVLVLPQEAPEARQRTRANNSSGAADHQPATMSSVSALSQTRLRRAVSAREVWSARRITYAVVAGVAVARLGAAFAMHGPSLLPDEYFYTAIARSIAAGGPPTVRGGPFSFVAVLGPLLTAPAWLVHNVAVAYRLVQAEGVLAMSLAAAPAFALARRVGLAERSAALAAIFAVLVPDMGFSAFLMTEPFAYPLFLLTIVLAVDALAEPTARREMLFLASWIALCLARVQFFFLEPAFLVAAAAVRGVCRASARSSARTAAALGLPAAALCGIAVVGPGVLVGQYSALRNCITIPR